MFKIAKKISILFFAGIFLISSAEANWITKKSDKSKETIKKEEDTNKIHEAADVFYHLAMYLEANNIKIEDVMSELDKRKK